MDAVAVATGEVRRVVERAITLELESSIELGGDKAFNCRSVRSWRRGVTNRKTAQLNRKTVRKV